MNMAEHKNLLRGELREREPMARHVSWRAGGALSVRTPADLDGAAFLVSFRRANRCGWSIGGDLLVRDGGLRGAIFTSKRSTTVLRSTPARVTSRKLALRLDARAGGRQFAGIPGTVGGALAMNAGCHGGQAWDIVASVTSSTGGRLRAQRTTRSAIGVVLRECGEWFVAARFGLPRGDTARSRAIMKELLERRIATQPLEHPNAGSVFRNPHADYAARLIEACGLKGRALGGAMISPKHANFIVNTGNASAADIEALIELALRSSKSSASRSSAKCASSVTRHEAAKDEQREV